MGTVLVEKGTPDRVDAVTQKKITALVTKGKKDSIRSEVAISETIPLPLACGQEIGTVTLYDGEEILAEYPLVAAETVEKATFRELAGRLLARIGS